MIDDCPKASGLLLPQDDNIPIILWPYSTTLVLPSFPIREYPCEEFSTALTDSSPPQRRRLVACAVQDYAVSGEAILISRESGTQLALDSCATFHRLFVNNDRVNKIAKCFRIFDSSTFGRWYICCRCRGQSRCDIGEIVDIKVKVDIEVSSLWLLTCRLL